MSDLERQLRIIEDALRRDVYRRGPWSRFVADAAHRPRAERLAVAEQTDRVSEMLHRSHHRPEIGLRVGGLIGTAATVAGFALVESGRDGAGSLSLLGAILLIVSLQPLIKTCVGLIVGIRFSGVYLRGVEPRVKLRFGTYLAAPAGARVAFHLAGMVGSPAGAAWAWHRGIGTTSAALVIAAAFWTLVAIQFVTLMLGLTRRGRRLARISSGGMAGWEIRSAFTRR